MSDAYVVKLGSVLVEWVPFRVARMFDLAFYGHERLNYLTGFDRADYLRFKESKFLYSNVAVRVVNQREARFGLFALHLILGREAAHLLAMAAARSLDPQEPRFRLPQSEHGDLHYVRGLLLRFANASLSAPDEEWEVTW